MPHSARRAAHMKHAVVLFAHGARDPEWSAPLRAIRRKLAARLPGVTVELAFLETTAPALPETLDKLATTGHDRVTIAPLFMAQGSHLKRDIPRLLDDWRLRYPAVELALLPAIGEAEAVLDAITEWLAGSLHPERGAPPG
jgi:sirohydrochlorin cobaltochelatase